MYRYLYWCGLIGLLANEVAAQERATALPPADLIFCSPEFQWAYSRWEVRLRTLQYTQNTRTGAWTGRQDVMLGWVSPSKHWRVFSYTQLDDAQRAWTGVRVDRNWQWPGSQLQLNLQYRFFVGLNQRSAPYQFGFGLLTYPLMPGLRAGAFGFAKDWWTPAKTGQDYAFLGPMLQAKWSDHIGTLTGLGRDLTGHYRYLLMLRLAVRL